MKLGELPLSTRIGGAADEITELRSSVCGPIRSENSGWLFWSTRGLAWSASFVMPRSMPICGKYKLIATPTPSSFLSLPLHLSTATLNAIHIHQVHHFSSTFFNPFTTFTSNLQLQSKCLPKPQQRRSPPARRPPQRHPLRRRKLARRPLQLVTRRREPRPERRRTPLTSTKVQSHFTRVALFWCLGRVQNIATPI